MINDEAHHCYRRRAGDDLENLTGDDRKEVEKEAEKARVWIGGLGAIQDKLGIKTDLRPLGDALLPARVGLW